MERNQALRAAFDSPSAEPITSRQWWVERIYEQDRERVLQAFQKASQTGQSVFSCDYRFRRNDGLYANVHDEAFLLRNPDGITTGAFGILTDLSSLREVEEKLAELENLQGTPDARFHSLSQSALDAIITITEHGIIQSVNPAAESLFRFSSADLTGKNISIIMPDPHRHKHDEYLERYLTTGIRTILDSPREMVGRRSDATLFPMRLQVTQMTHDGERVFVGTMRDLTHLRDLENQLRQSQKMEALGLLAGGIAHDFNNLLTAINGFAALLIHKRSDDAEVVKDANMILDSGRRAAKITSQLLSFSRKQFLDPQVLNLNDSLAGMEELLRRLIGENIRLELDLNSETHLVLVDPTQLEQALMNLAINARDAMPQGGVLTMTTENLDLDTEFLKTHPGASLGPHAVLEVSDTGTGIEESILSKIFEPFFTTKGVGGGTGLGLSMIYGFVKQSGGYITVDSQPGEGARFRILLPFTPAPDPSPDVPQDIFCELGGTERILIIEDEPAVRELMRNALEQAGYDTTVFGSAEQALEFPQASASSIYLVISDVMLPGMSGSTLISKLKESNDRFRSFFISGYPGDHLEKSFSLPRDTPILQKPFTPDELLEKVRTVLDA